MRTRMEEDEEDDDDESMKYYPARRSLQENEDTTTLVIVWSIHESKSDSRRFDSIASVEKKFSLT